MDKTELEGIIDENCGLAAAINVPHASGIVRDLLAVQQHRGEKSARIVSRSRNQIYQHGGMGTVEEIFPEDYDFRKLPGNVAIGHNRYATKGSSESESNIQPFIFSETKYGLFCLAHNGQLVDKNGMKKQLIKNGAIFQSNSDTEAIAHLLAHTRATTLEQAVANGISQIPAAYSLLFLTRNKIMAVRDKYGVRPLSIAKLGEGFLIASENGAFRIFDDAEYVADVKPGEMVVFDRKSRSDGSGFRSISFAEPNEHWCIFEGIYFSEPRSGYNGYYHEEFRQECGKQVYRENKEFFDELMVRSGTMANVVPILDSGKQGAIGFCKVSGIPYKEYFLRRHNAPKSKGRSYTAASQSEREITAFMKLDLRKEKIKDKVIVTIDDSTVRGTTSKKNNKRLRDAGAEMIVNVFLSPPIIKPCYLGMDHQRKSELVAYNRTTEEIAKELKADKVIYLSPQGLHDVVSRTYKSGICSGCFGGSYPVERK